MSPFLESIFTAYENRLSHFGETDYKVREEIHFQRGLLNGLLAVLKIGGAITEANMQDRLKTIDLICEPKWLKIEAEKAQFARN